MESIETLPQKIVDQKVVVLKSYFDSAKVRSLCEENKTRFFTRLGFLKPNRRDITLIDFFKYYEPFVVIGGKYSIDYCKKHLFEFKTDSEVKKFFVGSGEVKLESFDPTKPNRMLKFVGEERCHSVNETFIVIDKLKRELPHEKLHLAPFEDNLENVDKGDLRKVNISVEEEIEFIKSKIVKRPSNADFVMKEMFEINDRMIVYNPMFELVFQGVKKSQVVTLRVDGVTGRFTVAKLISTIPEKLNSSEKVIERCKDFSKSFQESSKTSYNEDSADQNVQTKEVKQNNLVNHIESTIDLPAVGSQFELENATILACNLLKRLGFKNKITPLEVLPEGDSYIVEVSLQDRIAKLLVNTKTKEVKNTIFKNQAKFSRTSFLALLGNSLNFNTKSLFRLKETVKPIATRNDQKGFLMIKENLMRVLL